MIKVSIDRQVMQSVMSGVADQIKSKIDLNHVKKICKKEYGIETIKGVEHKDANIVVIENQAACKLDLEVLFSMSIIISAKDNSNSTLPANNDTMPEFDEMMADSDIPEELDDIPDELDIPQELDDILEKDSKMSLDPDITKQLDDLFGEQLDDKEVS